MAFFPEGMPTPMPTVDDKGFWDAAKRHELAIQRCTDCGTYRHSPLPCCYNCQSFNYEWAPIEGKGTVYSYVNCVHPVHPALREKVPYNVVVVELPHAGNVRMVGNIVDAAFEDIHVGMPVEVYWDDINEDITVPRWQKAKS